MRPASTVTLLVVLFLSPTPASAWGFDAHRFIVQRAIDLLPPEIRPFFEKHRLFVSEHAVDPDLWRSAGFTEEPPRHFVDLDAYGGYPFEALPRDYRAAEAKHGKQKLEQYGLLPWRAAEIYGRLVTAFEQQKKGAAPVPDDIKFFSAVLGHYVGDAHVPFHAALNYDGQLTNQHGIHRRFESELFERYRGKLSYKPSPPRPASEARDLVFDALLSGFRLVDPILKADRDAIGSRDVYDDPYFDRFLAGVQPILERRLSEAMTAVAAVIAGAWTKAGRPDLPPDPVYVPRKVRRP